MTSDILKTDGPVTSEAPGKGKRQFSFVFTGPSRSLSQSAKMFIAFVNLQASASWDSFNLGQEN